MVTWKDVRANASLNAPEETILYSLVKGKILIYTRRKKFIPIIIWVTIKLIALYHFEYTQISGKSELVMFGGIQKDVSSLARGNATGASSDGDTVSNAVYFLNPPNNVV